MTAWVTINVPTAHNGVIAVRAFPTAVPGLVVIPPGAVPDDTDWALTHARSGLALGFYDDPESAQRAAVALHGVTDFTDAARALLSKTAAIRDVLAQTTDSLGNGHGSDTFDGDALADRNVA